MDINNNKEVYNDSTNFKSLLSKRYKLLDQLNQFKKEYDIEHEKALKEKDKLESEKQELMVKADRGNLARLNSKISNIDIRLDILKMKIFKLNKEHEKIDLEIYEIIDLIVDEYINTKSIVDSCKLLNFNYDDVNNFYLLGREGSDDLGIYFYNKIKEIDKQREFKSYKKAQNKIQSDNSCLTKNKKSFDNINSNKLDFSEKFKIIPFPEIFYFSDSKKENLKNTVARISLNKTIKMKKYEYKFSRYSKKFRGYLYEKEMIHLDVDAINQIDFILNIINTYEKNIENLFFIQDLVNEIHYFIKNFNLESDTKNNIAELDKSFYKYSIDVKENKFDYIKNDLIDYYNDLCNSNLKINELGAKYPQFFLKLCKDDIFNYFKEIIKHDKIIKNKLKFVLDHVIKNYEPYVRHKYNGIVKKLKNNDYINKKEESLILEEYEYCIKHLSYLNKLKKYFNNFKPCYFKEINIAKYIEKNNTKFISQKINSNKEFFNNFNGHVLDDNQRKIIVSDENNSIIIAGAGSGKTFTLQAKIKYLIDFKKVSQDKILCISFSNASVDDLRDKIKKTIGENDIDIFTFHSLGGSILKQNNIKNIPNTKLLKIKIEDYFKKNVLFDEEKIKKIVEFFNLYNYNLKVGQNEFNWDDYDDYIEIKEKGVDISLKDKVKNSTNYNYNIKNNSSSNEIKTLKRDYVRSFEELIIANFLFINNIEYIYEGDYFSQIELTNQDEYVYYRPDFYLPKDKIFIEHYGVDRNLIAKQLPEYMQKKYKKSIFWKREIHKKYNSTLVETFSYENSEGVLLSNLKKKLENKGVIFSEIDYKRIYESIIINEELDKLENVMEKIKKFIELFKTIGLCIDENGNDCSEKKLNEISDEINQDNLLIKKRNKFLFDMIKDIYSDYEKKTDIDYADMINKPIKLLKNDCKFKDYDYIFVDEYQDTSYTRYRLLNEVKNRTNANLTVVGDDWQSIYAFNGCDIELFKNFEKYFSYPRKYKLTKTYRHSNQLIDVSSSFIMRNNSQIKKELTSNKNDIKPIKITTANDDISFKLIFENIVQEIVSKNPKGKILVLGRFNNDVEQVIKKDLFEIDNFKNYKKILEKQGFLNIKYMKNQSVDIKFRSIHKSKGLDEDNVIIIGLREDLKDGNNGFPSKIPNDPLFDHVLKISKEDIDYAEERRLFYVALTRTKNNVFLIFDENHPSEFYKDLLNSENQNKIEFRKYSFNENEISNINKFKPNKYYIKKTFKTNLICKHCGQSEIVLYKKYNGKGDLSCPHCNFYYGKFNQDEKWLKSLEFCRNDGCNGLNYIMEKEMGPFKVCTFFYKNKCNPR